MIPFFFSGLIQEEMITIGETEKRENKKGEEQKVLMMYLHPKRIRDTSGNHTIASLRTLCDKMIFTITSLNNDQSLFLLEINRGMMIEDTILIIMIDGSGETKLKELSIHQ